MMEKGRPLFQLEFAKKTGGLVSQNTNSTVTQSCNQFPKSVIFGYQEEIQSGLFFARFVGLLKIIETRNFSSRKLTPVIDARAINHMEKKLTNL
jgi:hypothetical protein